MLDKIEAGKKYLDSDGNEVEVLFVGRKYIALNDNKGEELYQSTRYALNSWAEITAPKKRYWLWDVKTEKGEVFKSATYMNEDGRTTLGRSNFQKEHLIKKHENEFIEA